MYGKYRRKKVSNISLLNVVESIKVIKLKASTTDTECGYKYAIYWLKCLIWWQDFLKIIICLLFMFFFQFISATNMCLRCTHTPIHAHKYNRRHCLVEFLISFQGYQMMMPWVGQRPSAVSNIKPEHWYLAIRGQDSTIKYLSPELPKLSSSAVYLKPVNKHFCAMSSEGALHSLNVLSLKEELPFNCIMGIFFSFMEHIGNQDVCSAVIILNMWLNPIGESKILTGTLAHWASRRVYTLRLVGCGFNSPVVSYQWL